LIETGSSTIIPEATKVLYGNDNIIKTTLETFVWVKERMVGSLDSAGPAIHIIYEPIWDGLVQLKKRGIKIRVVTEITSGNIAYCKKLMDVCELRHLDGVRTNFAIADGRQALLHGVSQETIPLSQAILTTVKGIVEAQEYLFENLWKNAIPAQYKIMEIEEGIMPTFTEIIRDTSEIQKLVFDLVASAKEEIVMLLFQHTIIGNLFLKEKEQKIMAILNDAIIENGVRVRILTSKDIHKQLEEFIGKQKSMMMPNEV
jgi:two-component system sensor histidine kinase VicK